ncbi:glutamate ABC transporter substrate-binding protein [Kutzneria viridogrisea]|uniref:Glutamate-binding protein n=2 Tax=Kutzneria TaxID=43356 RepID=W5W5G0_9PSEU|nr:glutamate ABC transporter substrate-binding protein [Kutzneria albida]AHH96015.1 glutamate-binding protein [Kutzneria albida DSM 43870]MBA8928783.1 glutamate transport system substrate-binding protein [Kutzneria viridogrisea]
MAALPPQDLFAKDFPMPRKAVVRLSGLLTALVLLTACGPTADGNSLAGKASSGKLTIGIGVDQPGLGFQDLNGGHSGFDIDVATYVAKELGVDASGITWAPTVISDRAKDLQEGKVDMVVEAFSITDDRKKQISFAGPYFVAGQDLLVRLTSTDITGPESLNNNKKLCSVAGSTSAQDVRDKFAQGAKLVEYVHFTECVTALFAGIVDAVTTDDLVLAGLAAQNPELLRVVGKPFTKEYYGIGLRKGDTVSQAKVDAALQKMMDSGAWKASLQRNFGSSGYRIPSPPQITER